MLQYKIPQNVGIEDKIVGPFSLRQLIILGVGLGISYTLFAVSNKLYQLNVLEYIVICLPAIIALAAALLKIRNVTFTKFVLLSLEFAIRPKKRLWDHHGIAHLSSPDLADKASVKPSKIEADVAEKKRSNINLDALSATLDSGGFTHVKEIVHEDIDKVDDDDLITQAYFGHRRKEGLVHNMYWRTRDVQKKKLDLLAKLPKVKRAEDEFHPPPSPAPQELTLPTEDDKSVDVEPSTILDDGNEVVLRIFTNHRQGGFSLIDQEGEVVEHLRITNQKPESGLYKFAFKLKPGLYNIDFLSVPGYDTPASQSIDLIRNQKIEGIYRAEKTKVVSKLEPKKPRQELEEKVAISTKKKRKRKKKGVSPVREKSPVNTILPPVPEKKRIQPAAKTEAITSISDLQSGGEIEFNLN